MKTDKIIVYLIDVEYNINLIKRLNESHVACLF
jgi:hypothetical protein